MAQVSAGARRPIRGQRGTRCYVLAAGGPPGFGRRRGGQTGLNMLRRMLLGALILVGLCAAPAAAEYSPSLVTPTQVLSGGVVSVSGSGCEPQQAITLTVYPETTETLAGHPTTAPIISVDTVADDQGNFSLDISIPVGLAPGWYDILGPCQAKPAATRAAPTLYLVGRFLVVAPSTQPGATGNGTTLPRTGSDVEVLAQVGAGLLVAGGLVLVATKRRRHGSRPTAA